VPEPQKSDELKEAEETNKLVKVISESDEYTNVYQNPDGTKTADFFESPVNYRDKNGDLQKIDNEIVCPDTEKQAEGIKYTNKAGLVSAALIGLGFGAIQSSTQAIVVKITPQHRLGLANSIYFMFSDIGMGIGPLLVGYMIPFTGYSGMYMVMAMVGAVCLLLYYLLHGKKAKYGEILHGRKQ